MKYFLIRALVIAAVFLGLFLALPHTAWNGLSRCAAFLSYMLLQIAGVYPTLSGSIIGSSHFSIEIIDQCLGIDIMLLLVAFVLAYPSSIASKIQAVLLGLPALFAANIIRITAVFLIASYDRSYFELSHVYFGQIFMIVVLAGMSLLWLSTMETPDGMAGKSPTTFLLRLFGISSVLFVLWILLQKPYIEATEAGLKFIAHILTGKTFDFVGRKTYDYTFNFVTFFSLILATNSIPWQRKLRTIPSGAIILIAAHFLFRTIAVFTVAWKSKTAYAVSIGIFSIAGYLVPILLWVVFKNWNPVVTQVPVFKSKKSDYKKRNY